MFSIDLIKMYILILPKMKGIPNQNFWKLSKTDLYEEKNPDSNLHFLTNDKIEMGHFCKIFEKYAQLLATHSITNSSFSCKLL